MVKETNKLLTLVGSLSILTDKAQIIKMFTVGLNSIFENGNFEISKGSKQKHQIEIATSNNSYTSISYSGKVFEGNSTRLSVVQNAAQILAIIIEQVEQRKQLQIENKRLEKLSNERASKENYQSNILENIYDSIIGLDIDGIIISWNKASEELYGWKEEEAIGKSFQMLIKPEYIDKTEDEVSTQLYKTGYYRGVVQHYHKNGNSLFISGSVSFTTDLSGNRTGIISVNHDVTKQKLIQEKILNNERKYESLYKNNPLPYHSLNKQGEIVKVNEAWLSLLGYNEDEVLGKKYDGYLHKDFKKSFGEKFPLLKSKGYVNDVHFKLQQKNGNFIDISLTGRSVYHIDGTFKQTYCVFQDVTERRYLEDLHTVESEFISYSSNHSAAEILTKFLDFAEKLTDSEIGFYHFIEDNEETVSIQAWSERTKKLFCKLNPSESHYSISKAGVWVDSVKKRQPVIHNNYNSLIHKKGLPEDHSPILRELTVPVIRKDKVVAVLGVGNKKIDYNKHDVNKVQHLANLAWETIKKKQLEEEKEEKEELLTSIAENYPNSYISIIEKDLTISFSSGQEFKKNNLDPNEFVGLGIEDVFGENTSLVRDYYIRSFVGEECEFELFINGQYQIYKTVPLFSKNGDIQRVLVVVENISQRKEAEQHLIDSESRFKALHNASFGGITIHDKGLILDCNFGLSTISGYSQEELIGMDGLLLIADSFKDIVMNNIITSYEEPYEVIGLKKDGSEYPLRLEGKTIPFKGKVARVVEFRDITEQKQTENKLVNAIKKANESDRLKSAFLATMSHELRTPLNAIIGFSDILSGSLTDESDKNYAEIVLSSGQHLLSIVDDLFDIVLIESGESKMSETEFDINTVIDEILQIIIIEKKLIKKNKLEINIINPNPLGCIIKSDKLKIKQILINLLRNAIKFTDDGVIDFGYSLVENKKGPYLEFFIKDPGIGISDEKQKIIFDIFKQVDDSHTRQFGGTGIGLSIAKKLTVLLGGEIWVKSKIGEGSDFHFSIPFKPGDNVVDENESKKSSDNKLKGVKVLIAEDDHDSYFFLDIILQENSIQTLWVDNGKSAIACCRDNPDIDLVLMDINLPIMNGYEATSEIKKFRPELPIIAQTAYAISGDKEKALNIGCDDYISKPIKKEKLMSLVMKHLK